MPQGGVHVPFNAYRRRTTVLTGLTVLALLAMGTIVFALGTSVAADDVSESGPIATTNGGTAETETSSSDELEMNLQLNEFLSPGFGNDGLDIPAYVGYSTQTRFEGPPETQRLDRDLVSETIAVPRSDWSPGEGADEWGRVLGFVMGPLSPNPRDVYADSFYLWTGMQEGALTGGGDTASHIKVWPTAYDAYQVPHTPTGEEGTFVWEQDPAWANVLHKTSTSNTRTSIEGENVRGPASTSSTGVMYVNQVLLQVEEGDIDATDGDVMAPSFEFSQETPPGTVMNVQSVSYQRAGPWGDHVDLDIDFHTGIASGPTGEWRLPVDVTLEQGGFWPERMQPPGIAAPQYTMGLNAKGVPLLPEDPEAGVNDLHLVSDLSQGESYVTILGLLQEDGTVETVELEIDEPGPRIWRVSDGEVLEVSVDDPSRVIQTVEQSQADQAEAIGGPVAIDPSLLGQEATDPMSEDENLPFIEPQADTKAQTSSTEEEASTGEQPDRGFSVEVNEAGRPVVRNFTQDGTRLVDNVDTPRILTPDGPIALNEENRDGRAVSWENPAGEQGRARAAYHAGDVLVVVQYIATPSSLATVVETHSLTGEPVPHDVETVASLEDAAPFDRLSGEVTEATRFFPSDVRPRLTMSTPEDVFQLEPLRWDGAHVEIRNDQQAADGQSLTDPTYAAQTPGSEVWGSDIKALQIVSRDDVAPKDGAFTSLQTYRTAPELGLASFTQGKFGGAGVDGAAIEPTRNFDGYEPIGIALGAETANGEEIPQEDIDELFLHLRTLDGETFFSGTITEPTFTPDGGETWGVILYPNGDLDPADITVYARAVHADGLVAMEDSPQVAPMDRQFHIDRIPLNVTSTENAAIEGTTEPLASVTIEIPELATTTQTTANTEGTFAASVDLSQAPGGDYEAVVHAIAPTPGEPKDILSARLVPLPGLQVPEDDAATTTARIHHAPGGLDAGLHRDTALVDQQAAVDFLTAEEQDGVWDGALRPTAWAVQGLSSVDASTSEATPVYLDTLASDGGFAWRAGESPSATATGLATQTASALGEEVSIDPLAFLRWDGSADAGAQTDASSIEATAALVLALAETGELEGLDPWWKAKITGFLETNEPTSPTDAYASHQALAALGASPGPTIEDESLDAVAYSVLAGAGTEADLAPYQLHTGGFTLAINGDRPEAMPTGLALAALNATES